MFTLYTGERLDLSCAASDSTQAVNWTKDRAPVADGERLRIQNGHLEIESVEPDDSGLYACSSFGNHSGFFNISGTPGWAGPRRTTGLTLLFCLSSRQSGIVGGRRRRGGVFIGGGQAAGQPEGAA